MSAAELELTYHSTESDRVEHWRHEELARAGYDAESALVLAASHDVDLHEAVEPPEARLHGGSRAPDPPVGPARPHPLEGPCLSLSPPRGARAQPGAVAVPGLASRFL